MNPPTALRMIRQLAADSAKIVVIPHAQKRQNERSITRPQIVTCLRCGAIEEGPFLNVHGNWQVTMRCYSAGEELACVVAIDWPNQVIVITTF